MGFSSQQYRKGSKEKPWQIHPVWRGIGCILLLIVPFMSWFAAQMILESRLKATLPYQLVQVVVIPLTHVTEIDKLILQVNHYFQNTNFMFGQVFLTVIFSFIGFGIIALLYAILYKIAGPPRYGPLDIPQNKIQ